MLSLMTHKLELSAFSGLLNSYVLNHIKNSGRLSAYCHECVNNLKHSVNMKCWSTYWFPISYKLAPKPDMFSPSQ
jgi:hypothetical protein